MAEAGPPDRSGSAAAGEPAPGAGAGPPASRRRGRVRRIFLDTTPLREHREFRLLWFGQVVSGMGNQVTRIALPFQVYVLTGSTLAIGALVLAQLIPILVFSLGAGSLADAVDRRKVLIVTQVGMGLTSLCLVGLAILPAPPLAAIFAVAFIAAGLSSVDGPTRSAAIPRLVSPGPSACGNRPEPAQLPGRLGGRAGDRRPAPGHGRPGRGVFRRCRDVRGLPGGTPRHSRRCRRSAPSGGPGSPRSARACATLPIAG